MSTQITGTSAEITALSPQTASKLEEQSETLVNQFFHLDMQDVSNLQQHSIAIRKLGVGVQQ